MSTGSEALRRLRSVASEVLVAGRHPRLAELEPESTEASPRSNTQKESDVAQMSVVPEERKQFEKTKGAGKANESGSATEFAKTLQSQSSVDEDDAPKTPQRRMRKRRKSESCPVPVKRPAKR